MRAPASYHQERLWFIDKFESKYVYESSPTYHNIPVILEISGFIDEELLETSIKNVIHRHEVLRTQIFDDEGKIFQHINNEIEFKLKTIDLIGNNEINSHDEKIALAIKDTNIPFSLDRDLLIRSTLYKVEEFRYILVIVLHHIIVDRSSIKILLEEMLYDYKKYSQKQIPDIPDLEIHFIDFSMWQKELPRKLTDYLLGYWKKKLKGKLKTLEFPTDRQRAFIHKYYGSIQFFTIPGDVSKKIDTFSNQNDISNFVTLLGAFKVLLFKYMNQEEIVVGTSVENREQPGTSRVIGPLANLLVLRSFLTGNSSFNTFIPYLKKTIKEATEYQNLPFDKLVSELKPDIDMSRTALFDVFFQYDEDFIQPPEIDNLETDYIETNLGWGKYDFNLLIQRKNDYFQGIFVYNSEYFNHSTILRLIERYKKVINDIINDPDQQIFELSLLTNKEKKQVLYEFNDTNIDYPGEKLIHGLFEEQVTRTPGNIALIFNDNHVTYTELNKRSNRLARLLRDKGVKPDLIVGIMVERSIEMIIGLLGILKSGGAYLPIDHEYPANRVTHILRDSNVLFFLVQDTFAPGIKNAPGECSTITMSDQLPGKLKEESSDNLDNINDSSDISYVIYTSGTTGKPKGMMIEHKNVVSLLFNKEFMFSFNGDDVWTMFHSYCFDFSIWEMYGALLFGGKLIVIPKIIAKDTEEFLEILKSGKVTVLNQTPTVFYSLQNSEMEYRNRNLRLRYIIFGGEALNPGKLKFMKEKYPGIELINMYGITETTVHATYKKITKKEIEQDLCNIGNPLPTLTIYIMDRCFKILPVGIPGEMFVGGEGVGRGYLNNIELNEQKFLKNPYKENEKLYRSGDLAKFLENGELEYLGRIDEQVKVRGFRIELGEVESHLLKVQGIKEAVVTARENELGDKFLCGYLIKEEKISKSGIRSKLAEFLPDYMIPSYFVQIEKIPLTANGKIDRKALPEPEIDSGDNYEPPRNEIEEKLCEVWSEVLKIDRDILSINSSFFELGGDSIKAIQVSSRLKKCGLKVSIQDLFLHPHISELSSHVREVEHKINPGVGEIPLISSYSSPGERELTSGDLLYKGLSSEELEGLKKQYVIEDIYTLSPMQEGMYFHSLYNRFSTAYFEQSSHTIKGNLNIELIEKSLNELLKRHDILRTNFIQLVDHGILQVVQRERLIDFYYEDISRKEDKPAYIIKFKERDMGKTFDLSKDVLMRVSILQADNSDYELIWSFHHILMDGWCIRILIFEFIEIYTSYIEAREYKLPKVNQYKAFIKWLGTRDQELSGDYWKKYLEGYREMVSIPGRKVNQGNDAYYSHGEFVFNLDIEETIGLNNLSDRNNVTINTIIQSLWGILLGFYNDKNDIVFGAVVSGRPAELDNIESMIGLFINTIPVRIRCNGDIVFKDLLKKVQLSAIESEPHHYYPLMEIQSNCYLKQDLFDHILLFQNYPIGKEIEGLNRGNDETIKDLGLEISNIEVFEQTNFDLNVTITPGYKISVRLDYNSNVYSSSFIERISKHFIHLVNQVISNEWLKIEQLTLLTNEEKNRIEKQKSFWLNEFHENLPVPNPPTDYPRPKVRTFEVKYEASDLGERQTQVLKNIALDRGMTLYMVLLSTLFVLLSKITNNDTIIVSTPKPGPRHPDLEKIIGMYFNTLAIKTQPNGDKSFSLFLEEVKEKILKVFENQDYPIENLIDHIAWDRDISHNPLFDTFFEMHSPGQNKDLEMPGQKISPYPYESKFSTFDFSLFGLDTGHKLFLAIKYSTELYSGETIRRFLGYLMDIIEAVIENQDILIKDIHVLHHLKDIEPDTQDDPGDFGF